MYEYIKLNLDITSRDSKQGSRQNNINIHFQ